MKILHGCLAAFYIDDFGYQENILPRIHKEQGHEVEIVASTETYLERVRLGYTQPGSYVSKDGIPVTRLSYVRWLPAVASRKLRIYNGLLHVLERFQPDVIFLHDCQFLGIAVVARYARRHGTIVHVDCHTDFINSARSGLSRVVLHGLIYRACAQMIIPVASRFFATLPLRAEFLRTTYGVPSDKIELLPFGADDSRLDPAGRVVVRERLRFELGLDEGQLVFVTGGKIDHRKSIHTLIEAFTARSDAGQLGSAVLLIFGTPEPSLRDVIERAARHPRVRWVGWIAAADVHRYFWVSDIAVFPGTHSVLWEEAVGLALPCVFKRWHGIEHVDLGGNCVMLDVVNDRTLGDALCALAREPNTRERMELVARERGPQTFSYTRIARQALGERC